MAKSAADVGATVLLSNHTELEPGEANPFDVGRNAFDHYFTLVEECTTAAKLRAAPKP